MGDHTETLQIDYDPTQISYEELLNIFWQSHDPTRNAWGSQYMVAVFYHTEEQKRLIFKTRDAQRAKHNRQILTKILPAKHFYLAEDYHQKYRLRKKRPLMQTFKQIYPKLNDFVNSTAAARVNGYLAGYGSLEQLDLEIESLGLSAPGRKKLVEVVRWHHG